VREKNAWMRVYEDPAGQAILDAAGLERADLIVMSTHGRGGLGPPYLQEALDAARGYLDRVVARPSLAGSTVGLRVEAGAPSTTIASIARREDVDLVVMATHGSGGRCG
jgi:nucleotide-binding universal stress UspA family protein